MPTAACVVLSDPGGRVLLVKENYGARRWGFPGGQVDPGEQPRDAAVREAWEEAGVRVVVEERLGVVTWDEGEERWEAHVFAGSVVDGEPRVVDPAEIESLGWFDATVLPTPLTRTASAWVSQLRDPRRDHGRTSFEPGVGHHRAVSRAATSHLALDPVQRAFCAVAVAGCVAVTAAVVASGVMSSRQYLCDYQTGGEAGSGVWSCADGISYFLPLMAVAGSAAGLVLIAYASWELRRASAVDLRQLSDLAAALGAVILLVTAIFLLCVDFPVWFAAPYFVVAYAGLAARKRPPKVFLLVLAVGVVACLASGPLVFTAPMTVATALTWLGAMLLRVVADRRSDRRVGAALGAT